MPAAAVLDVAQALDHPHARHRGMLLEGDYRGIASPIKLSRTPARLRSVPPALQEPAGA
ncbi:acyl-CoA transferase [Bordetella pertussis]|nr:acyl-CoA transferase [Bordetella pertussis]